MNLHLDLKLYHYWRSSSSWRVRWALDLKKVPYQLETLNLLNHETHTDQHRAKNPMGQIPVLEWKEFGKTIHLSESLAILLYLDQIESKPLLFPKDPFKFATVIQLCEIIGAGTQPLQNLVVLEHYSQDPQARKDWARHWITRGLKGFHETALKFSGQYSVGDELTAADLFLIPQLYNARRFEVDLAKFPKLLEIESRCVKLPEYASSEPSKYEPK